LNNEVTVKDLAEAFDRALATQGGLDPEEPFDAMVHSTGMLVVRSWLAADPLRAKRLKRLIALAPATFGSPLAKQGRSWLGSVFKGNKQLGPDFLEAGDRILELASSFTLAARRGRRIHRAAALRRRSRDALCVRVLRHRHLFGSAQAR